jgi:hypothetical protein
MTHSILNGKAAASYLSVARRPKRTRVHFLASEQERAMLEEAAKREGTTLSETARRLTWKALHDEK